jgi:uncharacterized protein YdeI (YjbR/CyaY-like superfamily)
MKIKSVKISAKRAFPAAAIPPAIRKVLAGNAAAKAVFEKMPPSHRNEYVKWISEAKKEETMQRRLSQLIPKLLAKEGEK